MPDAAEHRALAAEADPHDTAARLNRVEEALRTLSTPKPPEVAVKQDRRAHLAMVADVLKTLIPSLIILFVTFSIKDSVDLAIRERQLQLANVQAMGGLAADMQKGGQTDEQTTQKAVQLAAFGRYSIPFFIHVLEVGDITSQTGAERGLWMVSMSEPEEVCADLTAVIRNRTGLYRWTTHLRALRLLGEAGCGSAQKTVADYAAAMQSLENYQSWVRPEPQPDKSEYLQVVEQVQQTRQLLQNAPKPNWWRRFRSGGVRSTCC